MDPTRTTPAQVGTPGTVWRTVAGGQFHSCGLVDMGGDLQAFCWGFNGFGGLGRSGTSPAPTPAEVMVSPNTGWTSITASWNFACGVRDGQLLCWGDSRDGRLGTGMMAVVLPTEVLLVPAP
jgi:hypothetical protein